MTESKVKSREAWRDIVLGAGTIPVLIVEDNPDHAILARAALEQCGFEMIDVADSISAAFDRIKSRNYELILVDYLLPDGYGLDLLEWVSGNCTSIMITNQGSEKVATEAFKKGAIDYVVKDVLFRDALPDVVARAISEARGGKRLGRRDRSPEYNRLAGANRKLQWRNSMGFQRLSITSQSIKRSLKEIRDCLQATRDDPTHVSSSTQRERFQRALKSCDDIADLIKVLNDEAAG